MYICKNIIFLYLILVVQITGIIGDGESSQTKDVNLITEANDPQIININPTTEADEQQNNANINPSTEANGSDESNESTRNKTELFKANCLTNNTYGSVEFVRDSDHLQEVLRMPNAEVTNKNLLPGTCSFVMFYAKWCLPSFRAGPHFNAIARSYPHLRVVAVDAIRYKPFSKKLGITSAPTFLFVHNNITVARYDEDKKSSETLSKFISHWSNLKSSESLNLTPEDKQISQYEFTRETDDDSLED